MNLFKKFFRNVVVCFLMISVLFLVSTGPADAASKSVNVTVNGRQVNFDVKPYIDGQNRTIVPLRFVSEELGYTCSWNSATKEIIVEGKGVSIKLWAGKKATQVNGQQVTMDTVAVVKNGRALVPLRFVLENMGAGVAYDKAANTVNITNGNYTGDSVINGKVALVSEDNVNIRSGPDTSYNVVSKAKKGDVYIVSARSGQWYQVAVDGGKTGWIAEWLVSLRSADDLSSRSPEPGEGRDTPPDNNGKTVSISEIEVDDSGAEIAFTVSGDGKLEYSSFKLDNPRRLVLDFSNSVFKDEKYDGKVFSVNKGLVKAVRLGQSENQVRVVVDLNAPAGVNLLSSQDGGNKLKFCVSEPSINDKLIVIDPGHASIQPGGWSDPGAVGPNNVYEKDVVLDIAYKVKQKLEAKGADVLLTRTGDTSLTLAGRAEVANKNNADAFVSIHTNANVSRSINGTSTYYYGGVPGQSETRKKLASAVQKELVNAIQRRDIGVLTANFAVLRFTQVPSILVETAFISNYEEEKLLADAGFRAKIAEGIANGIERYFLD
ncbi:MAG: N-acetylmuramoyl-L-alanine amidase [Desulfitobacteriaceae bacterium]|nr:N-acetylmuramoyl-L-alanine amidase [Desulfitobacteriaceae bacterium]MDD4752773.1 N-acetylmuramoyl-L-alanine amidase [Desulfitobacteriaceae bacterium]